MNGSKNDARYDKESISMILEAAKSEYDHQYEISQKLDAKINIALALCGAIIATWAGILDVKNIIPPLPITESKELILFAVYLLSYVGGLACFLIALVLLILLVMPAQYQRLDEKNLIDLKLYNKSSDKTGMCICTYYIRASTFNQQENAKRSKKYSWCIVLLAVSIVVLFVLYILNNFM